MWYLFMNEMINRMNVKNYQHLSLLPIFGKTFERLIYNEMYSFFMENDLIYPNQWIQDSCINQLLPRKHDIYQSLDQSIELRCVFLDTVGSQKLEYSIS